MRDIEPNEDMFQEFEDMLLSSLSFLINVEPDAEKFLNIFTHFAESGDVPFLAAFETSSGEERRCLARMVAIQIWNHTPLASQHYRCKPLPKVNRNDPCLCGSHKKFKQCCGRLNLPSMDMFSQDIVTHYLLRVISKTELKQVWKYLPHDLLGFIASEWLKQSEELAERALLMLDPIFKQDDAQLTGKDELALDTMLDVCTALHKPRKKSALLERMMQHPNKTLKIAALHRQCCVLNDAGKHDEAWLIFQQAQRLAPNDPHLSHLEILLLMGQGKLDQMRQRASYWTKRLQQMGRQGEYDDLIEMIHALANEPSEAMGGIIDEQMSGVSRLIAWLQQVSQSVPKPACKVDVWDDISILKPKNKKIAALELAWSEHFMLHNDAWDDATDVWLSMLEEHPELAGSLMILDDLTRFVSEVECPNPTLIFEPLFSLVALQIQAILPDAPEKPLIWAYMDNRPALRLLQFTILRMDEMECEDIVMELLNWSLILCPEDNLGMRFMLMNKHLKAKQNQEAKALGEAYLDDSTIAMCYGYALALFRLGETVNANKALEKALSYEPEAAKALLRKSMAEPKCKEMYGMMLRNSAYDAWEYRQDALSLWKDSKGALAWLKSMKA